MRSKADETFVIVERFDCFFVLQLKNCGVTCDDISGVFGWNFEYVSDCD